MVAIDSGLNLIVVLDRGTALPRSCRFGRVIFDLTEGGQLEPKMDATALHPESNFASDCSALGRILLDLCEMLYNISLNIVEGLPGPVRPPLPFAAQRHAVPMSSSPGTSHLCDRCPTHAIH